MEVPPRVLAAIAPMPAGYVELLGSAVDLLAGRPEVRAVWLGLRRPRGRRHRE